MRSNLPKHQFLFAVLVPHSVLRAGLLCLFAFSICISWAQDSIDQKIISDIQKLKNEDDTSRPSETIEHLQSMGARAVPGLIDALKSNDARLRHGAAKAIKSLGPVAKAAVPVLVKSLDDQDITVSQWAARALASIGPEAKAAVPKLVDKLKDDKSQFPMLAIVALGRIGPEAKDAVPALIENIKDRLKDRSHGSWDSVAIRALGEIGPNARAAVPLIIEALEENDHDKLMGIGANAHGEAIKALGRIGPDAEAAVPAIVKRSLSDPEYRTPAREALKMIGLSPVTLLIQFLNDSDKRVRSEAAVMIGEMGPNAKAAVSSLFEAMREDDDMLSSSALEAIEKIDPNAKPEIPALIGLFRAKNSKAQGYAIKVFGRIGAPAVPVLIETLKDESASVREDAARAIGSIGPEAKPAIPALSEVLRDDDRKVRFAAGWALLRMGEEARPALPALITALSDKYDSVQEIVAESLGNFGADAKAALPALSEILNGDSDVPFLEAAQAIRKIVLKSEALPMDTLTTLQMALGNAQVDLLKGKYRETEAEKAAVGLALQTVKEKTVAMLAAKHEAPTGEATLAEAKCRYLIVQITGQLDGDPVVGTGIIFGYKEDRLYIATAKHLVRHFPSKLKEPKVRIKSLPGEPLPAELLDNSDEKIDLAVLMVRDVIKNNVPAEILPFDRGGVAKNLKSAHKVFAVGLPVESASVATPAGNFLKAMGDTLLFQSTVVRKGYSGGGLFNEDWQLIGMIVGDAESKSEAISLERIAAQLKDWGYPVNLSGYGQ